MAKLPRKARQTDGVVWEFDGMDDNSHGYLTAAYTVRPGKTGYLRVYVPGSAVLDQAVNLIQGRINQQRYAAAH